MDIYEHKGDYEPKAALEVWNSLYDSFQKVESNINGLHCQPAYRDSRRFDDDIFFLMYKDSITLYLQDFVQALQRRSYRIEGNLKLINRDMQTRFFKCVLEGEWLIPKVEEFFTREEYQQNLERRWRQLCRWFCGDDHTQSEMFLFGASFKRCD